jgi:hypothetical protein
LTVGKQIKRRFNVFVGWRRRLGLGTICLGAAYFLLLVYPQPLFAYEIRHAGIVVHATRPIPDTMRRTMERARARLERTALFDPTYVPHVFICEPRWLFALFARTKYRVGGIAEVYVGQHVFLRESDMDNDRLIGASGRPVPSDRPLSYFMAHEIMHLTHARRLGRLGYLRLPKWVDDGHADYVARDIDLAQAVRGLKSGAPELDPARSGLYVRYHLMVAYLVEKRGMDPSTLLKRPADRDSLERELAALSAW